MKIYNKLLNHLWNYILGNENNNLYTNSKSKLNIFMTRHQYGKLLLVDSKNFNDDFTEYRGKIVRLID